VKGNRILVLAGIVMVSVMVFVMIGSAGVVRSATFDSPLPPPGPLPEPGDTALFQELLMQLISGGLASLIVWKFLDAPVGKSVVNWLLDVADWLRLGLGLAEVVRYTAIVLTGATSAVAYLIALAFGFVPDPGSVAAWINLILALVGVSFTGSQVIHIRVKTARNS
jgi:hypothetical protein